MIEKNEKVKLNNIYHRPFYHVSKRILDVLFSVIFLVLFCWLYILIAIAVKVDEPHAPIFYTQVRMTQNEREFKIYKFRSMIPHADKHERVLLKYDEVSHDGTMFKMYHDPRVTKVGEFLRRHSLDELPQLFNVIKGDMALVGPRPPLPKEVAHYTRYDKQRLLIQSGCTGVWQVSGRNALNFKQMVHLDIKYINHASLWYDFRILFKTIFVIFKPNGAY